MNLTSRPMQATLLALLGLSLIAATQPKTVMRPPESFEVCTGKIFEAEEIDLTALSKTILSNIGGSQAYAAELSQKIQDLYNGYNPFTLDWRSDSIIAGQLALIQTPDQNPAKVVDAKSVSLKELDVPKKIQTMTDHELVTAIHKLNIEYFEVDVLLTNERSRINKHLEHLGVYGNIEYYQALQITVGEQALVSVRYYRVIRKLLKEIKARCTPAD